MLTAKVGESIINCFDGKYDRYRLKQWSSKGILKCPVCNGDYEYCHGEVVLPYFRHIGKECSGYYSESETDEHRSGKLLLYNWIKSQDGISNCKLESWIPETKQRPDIYFECNGEKFVIEYQCTPIASEFLIRRELYKLAGINDIWILGTEKYNIDIDGKGDPFHISKFKTIENEIMSSNYCLLYLNVKNKVFISNSIILTKNHKLLKQLKTLPYFFKVNNFKLFEKHRLFNDFFFIEYLDNFIFKDNKIKLNSEIENMVKTVENHLIESANRIKEETDIIKEKYRNVCKSSDYVGNIGEIVNIDVMLVDKKTFRSYFNTSSKCFVFADKKGNIYTWFTTTNPYITMGELVNLTGKIKVHSDYQDVKQTILSRCVIN